MLNGIISKRLASLDERLAQLRSWPLGTFEEFRRDPLLRSAVERTLQVCVEIMIDVGFRLVSLHNLVPAEKSSAVMAQLQQAGIIKDAETYAAMVRFRNLIVHRYETIEPSIVYDIVKNRLPDFERFAAEVKQYCSLQP